MELFLVPGPRRGHTVLGPDDAGTETAGISRARAREQHFWGLAVDRRQAEARSGPRSEWRKLRALWKVETIPRLSRVDTRRRAK